MAILGKVVAILGRPVYFGHNSLRFSTFSYLNPIRSVHSRQVRSLLSVVCRSSVSFPEKHVALPGRIANHGLKKELRRWVKRARVRSSWSEMRSRLQIMRFKTSTRIRRRLLETHRTHIPLTQSTQSLSFSLMSLQAQPR